MNNEIANLLRRCRNPLFLAQVLYETLARIGYAVMRRTLRAPWFYPASVRAVRRMLKPALTVPRQGTASSMGRPWSGELALCVGKLAYRGEPDWSIDFPDPEVTASLHRWNWLLQTATDGSPQQGNSEDGDAEAETAGISWECGVDLMRSWVRHNIDSRKGIAWEPYTTGERISNAYIFAHCKGGGKPLPADLAGAMREMACFLGSNIEYHGTDATGNHVVNNARALFYASALLEESAYSALSTAVLREALPLLVQDGFLREGSSHYQFLFTRWLLEIHWLAGKTGRREILSLVEPVARQLVQRCWFFLVRNKQTGQYSIPLVGDVSPDCPPQWLMTLPWSDLALGLYAPRQLPLRPRLQGWADLWPNTLRNLPVGSGADQRGDFLSRAPANWHRVDWKGWTLFSHTEPHGGRPHATHRHGDLTGFVMFWEGWPLFADSGRMNYQADDADSLGHYGVTARAHNSIVIDGFEPAVPAQSTRMPKAYCGLQVQTGLDNDGSKSYLTIEHGGFSRLAGDSIVHTRRFCLEELGFGIEDRLSGSHPREIETYFHFAPGVDVVIEDAATCTARLTWAEGRFRGVFCVDKGSECDGSDSSLELKIGHAGPDPGGWFFPAYGKSEICATLCFRESARLPWFRHYTLRLEDK